MKRATAAFALLCATAMAPASGARAWTPIAGQRPVWCKSVPYAMNSVGSADLGANTSQSETQRAFTDWTKAECADLPVQWNGTTASKPVTNDGNSIVGWIESGWPEEPAAIGVTGPIWTFTPSTGAYCIVEADMMLNGVNYLWTTQPGNGTTVNAYSILLHESGHYYGLGHSQTPSATMYFAYDGGVDSLQADDKNGICALYPGGSGVDCTTTGCPGGQQCVAGSCQKVIGDGSVCSVCSMDSDCGGANDYCLMYPDGGTYCGKACSNDADCEGENDRCVRTSGTSSQCARFDESAHPDCASSQTNEGCMFDSDCEATQLCDATTKACKARPTTGAALGAGCATAEACTTQLCLTSTDGGICSMTCDWLDASSCPTGFYCNATVTGTCGTGLCLAGSAGATAAGGQCQKDTDCSTLYCVQGACREPCIPNGPEACAGGAVCENSALAGCGICSPPRDIGDACETIDDCPTRLCAEDDGRTFCTKECATEADCPDGFTCESAGTVSICVPPAGPAGGDGSGSRGGCGVVGTRPGSSAPLWLVIAGLAYAAGRRRRSDKILPPDRG